MEAVRKKFKMKVMKIGIKSLSEGFKDIREAFYAAQHHLPFKPRIGTYFTSLEAARNFLTPRRVEILHIIKTKNPQSLYDLAKFAHRSFSSVSKDVDTLKKHGLIKLSPVKNSARNAVLPQTPYDAISLWINI